MSDSFWSPLRCFIIVLLPCKKYHCSMLMSRSENAIRLQLKSCLSSALTLVFFYSNTAERSIQWSFRKKKIEAIKKKKLRGLASFYTLRY